MTTETSSPTMQAGEETHLKLCITLCCRPDTRPNGTGMLIVVHHMADVPQGCSIYHATYDLTSKGEIKFERRDCSGVVANSKLVIPLHTNIPVSQHLELDRILASVPVPRPLPKDWKCQTWVREALVAL